MSDSEEICRVLRKLIAKNPMMYLGIPHSKLEMINKIQINLTFVTGRGETVGYSVYSFNV